MACFIQHIFASYASWGYEKVTDCASWLTSTGQLVLVTLLMHLGWVINLRGHSEKSSRSKKKLHYFCRITISLHDLHLQIIDRRDSQCKIRESSLDILLELPTYLNQQVRSCSFDLFVAYLAEIWSDLKGTLNALTFEEIEHTFGYGVTLQFHSFTRSIFWKYSVYFDYVNGQAGAPPPFTLITRTDIGMCPWECALCTVVWKQKRSSLSAKLVFIFRP